MRLVVDLQACQTDSRDRGIGRYAMSLVQAIASELDGGNGDLIVAIDMANAGRARDLRSDLRHRGVHASVVAYGYPPTQMTDASPAARKLAGQLRARFYASLRPDVLLISSFFETGTPCTTELDWKVLESVAVATIGYDLIPLLFSERYLVKDHFVTEWYRKRLADLPKFDLILSISEATKRDLVSKLAIAEDRLVVIDAGFDEALECACSEAEIPQRLYGLGIGKPFVLMVGNGDWRKNTMGALQAFAALPKPLRDAHELVLTQVGDDVKQALRGKYGSLRQQVRILGKVDDAVLALLYRGCKVFYFPSYYEGFGLPVLEAMAFNAPVLSSNAGALSEVVHDARTLFDPNKPGEGMALLAKALTDAEFREDLRRGAREHALEFTWSRTAHKAVSALRGLAERNPSGHPAPGAKPVWPAKDDIVLMADACVESGEHSESALENGLRAIAHASRRRVLVDISEIVRLDAKTGIQRVTRNFLAGLVSAAHADGGFDVEPFCWTEDGIRYAREYARSRLGVQCAGSDQPVRVEPSDLVFMLDSSWWSPERFDDLHARVHAAGGEVVWMVYDLIPINFPQTCNPTVLPVFGSWLTHAVNTSDGFVCISEATRSDLERFMDDSVAVGIRSPWSRSVHLGSDFDPNVTSHLSEAGQVLQAAVGSRGYFTALGTLEPRKGYDTVLDAFELLWGRGQDVVLVVIGKRGWNIGPLVKRIERHREHGRRLFWLESATDGDVRILLKHSTALIQASISEGFGLPLIEAGSLGVPLLASDIPVFHEVAGDGAIYFPVSDAEALSNTVSGVFNGGLAHVPTAIHCQSWSEASLELAQILGVTSSESRPAALFTI